MYIRGKSEEEEENMIGGTILVGMGVGAPVQYNKHIIPIIYYQA